VDGHNLMHLLYALNQAGQVTFRQNKMGAHTRLVAITATKAGYAAVDVPKVPMAAEFGHTKHAPSVHPGDGTDFRNQPSRAPGGPITITHVAPVIRPVRKIGPYPKWVPTVEAPTAAPPIVMTPVAYPLLRALAERSIKIETAAKLLEQAGQDDLALTALSKVDDYTDLEREAIALLKHSIAAGVVPA